MTPRGGARKGAGRKPLRDGERREPHTFRLLPETAIRLERLADANDISQAEVIDLLALEAATELLRSELLRKEDK